MSNEQTRSLADIAAAALGVALVVLAPLGCGNEAKKPDPTEQPHDFQIEVEVTDTDGEVVPEAPVKLDGKTVGYTDKEGKFDATIREKPGTKIELAIGDIDGYRLVDTQSVTEKLKLKQNLSGKGYKGVPVLLHAVAESVQLRYLVWVDATCKDSLPADACQGLLVRRGGEVVATTDRLGKAHFNLREQPDEKISVTIDTPESKGEEDDETPTFKPADPTYEMSLGIEPTIYRLEPTFEDPSEESDNRGSRRVYRQQNTGASSGSSADSDSGSSGSDDGGGSESSGGSDSAESSSGGGGGGGGGGDSSGGKDDGDGSIDLF
jgi:hypothetical protein